MFDCRHVNQKTSRQRDVRRDARAFLRNRFLRDLNEYFLAFTQKIGDGWLMSLASRLVAMTALIALITLFALALVAWTRATWFRRRRRCDNYLFLRLDKLYLALVVMTVGTIFARVHLSTGPGGRLLACATSSSSTSASGKLTARLAF